MRWVFALLLLVSLSYAEFIIERVDVTLSDISGDGSVRVHENIKFIMKGEYSISIYDSAISSNKLSTWTTSTGLKEMKFHVNPSLVNIRDLRLRPQPRSKCNPIAETCHGEIILDYGAYPSYEGNGSLEPVPGTGIFTITKSKPRTNRFTINPKALSFTDTPEGTVILEEHNYLTIQLPQNALLLDVNPFPSDASIELPANVEELSWSDIVLVKFSLVFDVEEGIDKEVSGFFAGIAQGVRDVLSGPQGIPLIVIVVVLVASYLYITMAKRRGEE